MATLSKSDIYEESVWVFNCPSCSYVNTIDFDPFYEDFIICEHCAEELSLEDN